MTTENNSEQNEPNDKTSKGQESVPEKTHKPQPKKLKSLGELSASLENIMAFVSTGIMPEKRANCIMKAINMQMTCSIKSAGKNDSSALTSEATDMATEFFLQNPEALRMLSPSLDVEVLEHIFKTLNKQA